jgi:hypothetical protein
MEHTVASESVPSGTSACLAGFVERFSLPEALLRKNLPVFIAALKEAGIDFVMYEYEGGNDNGCVQDATYYRYGKPGEIPAEYFRDVLEALVEDCLEVELVEAAPPTKVVPWSHSSGGLFDTQVQISDLAFELAAEHFGDDATDHLLGFMWYNGDVSSDGMIGLNVKTGKLALRGRESAYTYRDEEFSLDDALDGEGVPVLSASTDRTYGDEELQQKTSSELVNLIRDGGVEWDQVDAALERVQQFSKLDRIGDVLAKDELRTIGTAFTQAKESEP